ncbi:ABC transporter substrate-binding protein [Chitinimonas sp. PSY-7]|uniref:ABC transporter substrate binding protein n=1 Tax=Chitinimonas sp. PSY-7 TaxID=3459088 RepID=UPI00404029AC
MWNIKYIVLLGLAVLISPCTFAADKLVFILESYHPDFIWDRNYREALQSSLGPGYRYEIFGMDTKRLPKEKHAEMAEQGWNKIQEVKPDLVVLGDDIALSSTGPKLDAANIPGVYLGINNNPRNYGIFKNITGVIERPFIKRNVPLILSLLPGAKKILLLFDHSKTAEVILSEILGGETMQNITGATLEMRLLSTYADWQSTVKSAHTAGYDAIITGLYHSLKDTDGSTANDQAVISWTSANTPVPLFGFWDFSIGSDKAIGGLVISSKEQGKAAAEIVKKILKDKLSPSAIIPVTPTTGDYLFSKKQLKRFNLKLPQDIARQVTYID